MDSLFYEGPKPTDRWLTYFGIAGNQTVNGENKSQPVASGKTWLLDSKKRID
jgi:hypothetical protein